MIFPIKFLTVKTRSIWANKNSFTSGQGQYNIASKNRPSSAKWTIRTKPIDVNSMISSCLRNYNIIYEKELLFPSYKFCHDKKRGLEYGNSKYDPEIGNYEYNVDILNEKHPKFSIGKQTKGYSKGYKTQGPGQYEYKNYIGKEDQKIIMIAKSNSRLKEVNRRYVYGP